MMKEKAISSLKTIITATLLLVGNMVAVLIADRFTPGFHVGNIYNVVIIVIAANIANALLWPIFRRFLMNR